MKMNFYNKRNHINNSKNIAKLKFLMVFLSFFIAVLIYLLFRSKNLFYYQIIVALDIAPFVQIIREVVWNYRKYIPNWVIYSAPDGLWLFSMGIAFLYNRYSYVKLQRYFTLFFIITISAEFIQGKYGGHGTFIGTYDTNDVLCYIIGFLLSSIISYINWNRHHRDLMFRYRFRQKNEIVASILVVVFFTVIGFFPALVS